MKAVPFLLLALTATAGAEPIPHQSVAEALAALKARDGNGTIVTESDGWVVINEPLAAAQWSFTPPGHAAHPAVVRRVVRRTAGAAPVVEIETLCESPEPACAGLRQQFEALNERITQTLRGRSRPANPTGTP